MSANSWQAFWLGAVWFIACGRTPQYAADPDPPPLWEESGSPQALPPAPAEEPVVVPVGPGPWPNVPVKNYSADYGLGPIQSMAVDEGYNLWLLSGSRIGVLRPGDSRPTWTSGIGQAAPGFGGDRKSDGSSVICGGEAGRAYVGYLTYDLDDPYRTDPGDPEYQKGDVDVVRLEPDGTIALEDHLGRTTDRSGFRHLGVRNTNDWHYDEDRSVLVCVKVMRGRDRGEVYIGTNHGVTRIRGLEYNSHRHPVWDVNGSLRIGYNYALGIGRNGDVLIGNEWKIGIVSPPPALKDWDNHSIAPYRLNTYVHVLNSLEEMDYWRAFEQTASGDYFLGSERFGLWKMTPTRWVSQGDYLKVTGLPTEAVSALAATDDGSLFVGTEDQGLWRMDPSLTLSRVPTVRGSHVRQLLYDPTVAPSMLYVLTNAGLTVLRGH